MQRILLSEIHQELKNCCYILLPILYHLPGWIWKGSGPFGNTGGAVANLNFDKSNRRPTSPDIQLILIPVEADPFLFKTIVSNRNYKDDVFQHTSEKAKSERGRILFSYFINVVLLHPKSQGTVRLKSSDPFDKPRVDPNIFSNHKDLDTLIEEEFYKCLAIGESFFNYGCCTARMGVKEDGEAFVDPQLRVYGVERLRIAVICCSPSNMLHNW